MADGVKQTLATPIQLADQVTKLADDVHMSFRAECAELKAKTEKLAGLLRLAARADLYERPTRRIMDDTQQALEKALVLVYKCRAAHGLVKRIFTIIPAAAFKRMSAQLGNSIGDVSWLLRVSSATDGDDDDDGYLGLPPIASNEPILCLIWEQIAKLHNGSLEGRADAAASLASLARDNDRYGKLIVEEGGVVPLLRLVKEGRGVDGAQESAAMAIGLLGRHPDSVEQMLHAGVCTVFAKVLKEAGPMKVQAMVAWAVAELAANYPKCQDVFAQNNAIRLLVGHLAFETVQEHSKYTITSKSSHHHHQPMSIHSVVLANSTTTATTATTATSSSSNAAAGDEEKQHLVQHPMGNHQPNKNQMHSVITAMAAKSSSSSNNATDASHAGNISQMNSKQQHPQQHIPLSGASIKGREYEDPATKATMKAMAAKALWQLAKDNSAICKSITESKALLCFAVLLEKGSDEVQYNSAMALMEIARVAERDPDLRRSAFKPNSPAAKAVVDQLLSIIKKADYSDLLLPCITAIGCLSRTFRATETRIIGPLVNLIDETREGNISGEATVALTKFACTENYLHSDHSKAIINAGGTKHLVQLVYLGEQAVQIDALVLLCYIALHVPDSEELAEAEVLTVLEWASKQGYIMQDWMDKLLTEAKGRLELYQSRGSRGFH